MLTNLVLSGGGVRSYAHLGVYKYCFENNIEFNEIVAVSGGALISPFIYLRKNPDEIINIFKKAKIHKKLFPFYFIPDKFEILFLEPSTVKIGKWVESNFTEPELKFIKENGRLHIMATCYPTCPLNDMYTDMLKITDLKNAISASCAVSGIFKPHTIGENIYIDGAHWNNFPIFFNFKDKPLPLIAVSMGFAGLLEKSNGRFSKILKAVEISSYARFEENIKRWDIEKHHEERGDLFVIKPEIPIAKSFDFDLKDFEIDEIIKKGYEAAREVFYPSSVSSSSPSPLKISLKES